MPVTTKTFKTAGEMVDFEWEKIGEEYQVVCVQSSALAGHVETIADVNIKASVALQTKFVGEVYRRPVPATFDYQGVTYRVVTFENALAQLAWRDPVDGQPVDPEEKRTRALAKLDLKDEANQLIMQTIWYGITTNSGLRPTSQSQLSATIKMVRALLDDQEVEDAYDWVEIIRQVKVVSTIYATASSQERKQRQVWNEMKQYMFWTHDTQSQANTPPAPQANNTTNEVTLFNLLNQHFSIDDIEGLCFELGINHEDLDGGNKPKLARALVTRVDQLNQSSQLVDLMKKHRPNLISQLSSPNL